MQHRKSTRVIVTEEPTRSGWAVSVTINDENKYLAVFRRREHAKVFADRERKNHGLPRAVAQEED